MRENGQLNDLAAAEIAGLERDGIKLTPAEIVKLNAVGWAVEEPSARQDLSRGVPVPCGGAHLWPLTMNAADWQSRVGEKLHLANLPLRTAILHPLMSRCVNKLALGYAMANCYAEGNPFPEDRTEAARAVMAWASKLKCTAEGLAAAILAVIAQQDAPDLPPDEEGKPMSIGEFSAWLAATCGEEADFWEKRCAIGYAAAVLSVSVRQNMADGKPSGNDPRIMAERAMGWEIMKIRESRKAKEISNV